MGRRFHLKVMYFSTRVRIPSSDQDYEARGWHFKVYN